ncbi:photosynthetic complex assembly protein PuhC [Falsiroseomonas selenitidurans]|uniref:Photosynthetic complex assembly protein n=1 Tax=Falsiroseomonas selenitidurans TaxID=2716335 RepID=A0ABX1E9A0_9PROT|nr:photosynthetic complex assembly protein PuhC [Falsiroseomonas selenitidurans]NKC33809.1 hypothetical protein [Falsiroseomonas selenitidurans]
MAQALQTPGFLRRPALAGGLLVLATLVLVVAPPILPPQQAEAPSVALAQRDLHFADRADGAVVVTDAATGREVTLIAPGQGGFVRGTLRGLVRERRREEAGREAPFRLTAWHNGQLTLQDRATGRLLDLTGFGQTNAEAFLSFLSTKE